MSKSSGKKKSSSDDRMSLGRMMRVIGRFLKGQKHLFTLAGLMLTFEAVTAALAPQLLAYVIDYVDGRLRQISGQPIPPPATPLGLLGIRPIINPDFDTIAVITIGIILLTMLNSFGDSMAEIYLAKGGRSLGYNLRVSLYAHLQKLSLTFHDNRRTGDVLTRVTSDVAALEDFVISSLSDFVGSVLLIFFFLIFMVLRNWQVAVVAAIIIPIMALLSNYFTQRIKAASKKRRASEGELASAAQEMLTSIRVIQTYGLGSYEQAMFAAQSQKAMDAALEAAAYQARFSWFVSVLGAFATAAVIWLTVGLIFNAPVSVAQIGILAIYTKYISDMFKPTKRIIQEWNTFGKLYASIERIGDLLDLKPSVQDEPGAVQAPQFRGKLEFRDLYFSYPSITRDEDGGESKPRTALKNINFVIEPGQVVAVVGHTGAGKSTIAQLIPRLYDPNSGQILIDGHDIREYTLDSLRSQISMVLQESILFSGSVVENIAYGRPDASGVEIIAAATQANAHEFIEKLPEGYYTMLGERGSNLSGGQRQRLAIARAFIRNTSILIMDEPTTGLDAESTDLVLRALRKLMKGKTTIIISHDLNLIRDADKIIVIKAGEIEQMGTHDELIQAGGLYANLYMKQSGQTEVHPDHALPSGALRSHVNKMMNQIFKQAGTVKQSGEDEFYLPGNEHFLRRLPAMAEAFDPVRINEILSNILFDTHTSVYTLVRCAPGKAIYLPGDIVSLQYALEIRQNSSGETFSALVNARLFPDLADCKAYLRKQLAPLAKQLTGRADLAPFAKLAAVYEPLKMAFAVFPIDGDLPTLIPATDPKRMMDILNRTYPEALSGNFIIQNIHLDLAHYGRYQRIVLRITMEGKKADTQTPQVETVYGKMAADVQGGLSQQVVLALREMLHHPDIPYHFRIPLIYGFLPDLNLLLMEALPGKPIITRLLKNWPGNGGAEQGNSPTLDEAIGICARIAATLHQSEIKLGRRHSLEQEVAMIEEEIHLVKDVFPELGEQMHAWLTEVVEFAQTCPTLPFTLCHGDFTYNQLIFDGKDSGLVDFDTVCQAEPAVDIGQFLAYQRLSLQKDHNPDAAMTPEIVNGLAEHFLSTYIETSRDWLTDEILLRNRVMVYEMIGLLRLALHSWQKLKGDRLALALQLIEERMACLKQAN